MVKKDAKKIENDDNLIAINSNIEKSNNNNNNNNNNNTNNNNTNNNNNKKSTIYWRRGIVGFLFISVFIFLALLTPESKKEEIAVIFTSIWFIIFHIFNNRDLNEKLVTLTFAVALLGISLTTGIIMFINELIYLEILPILPKIWEFIIIFFLSTIIFINLWNILKGKSERSLGTSAYINKQSIDGKVLLTSVKRSIENPEPASTNISTTLEPDWMNTLSKFGPTPLAAHLKHLISLRRLYSLTTTTDILIRSTIGDELIKLHSDAIAEIKDGQNDMLSKTANFLEWGSQKLPELADMDMSDLIMGKVVADINLLSTNYEMIYVHYKLLRPIHAINRDSANIKCNERAATILKALPLLKSNNMRLSESLLSSESSLKDLQSVNGIQVVKLNNDDGYVTFEGNGRRESFKRAFKDMPDVDLYVEVRLFKFEDEKTTQKIIKQVEVCRKYKGVSDQ